MVLVFAYAVTSTLKAFIQSSQTALLHGFQAHRRSVLLSLIVKPGSALLSGLGLLNEMVNTLRAGVVSCASLGSPVGSLCGLRNMSFLHSFGRITALPLTLEL